MYDTNKHKLMLCINSAPSTMLAFFIRTVIWQIYKTNKSCLTYMLSMLHILLLPLSHFSRVQPCVTPQTAAHQAPRPWDSPGKDTGVDCHFLLQCMKVQSESEVAQSCPTLSNPMDCSLPGSSVHGISHSINIKFIPKCQKTQFNFSKISIT